MINILIVDDHQLVGEGTKEILSSEPTYNVEWVDSSREAIDLFKDFKYDVYVFDLDIPDINGFKLSSQVLEIYPDAKILIYTGHDISIYFKYLIDIGVSGFISKTYTRQQLIDSIRYVLDGFALIPVELLSQLRNADSKANLKNGEGISLTELEKGIILQISKGLTNDHISKNLHMSKRNVERILTKLYQRLQVSSRREAVIKSKELGLIPEFHIK